MMMLPLSRLSDVGEDDSIGCRDVIDISNPTDGIGTRRHLSTLVSNTKTKRNNSTK